MTTVYRLIIALAVSLPFSSASSYFLLGNDAGPGLTAANFLLFALACCISVLLTRLLPGADSRRTGGKRRGQGAHSFTDSSQPDQRELGTVKWFNYNKGFGFITRANGEDIFVHHKSLNIQGRRGLKEGQQVSFIVADTDKGLQAEQVELESR